MSPEVEIQIADVVKDRTSLEPILRKSFEGWYLRHSLRMLGEVERVRGAEMNGEKVGLTMLKTLDGGAGYLYYLAVSPAHRMKGIGGMLIDDAVECFRKQWIHEVYASLENEEAARLFSSRGFVRTVFSEVSKRYGLLRAVSMYRSMLSVPGEVLFRLDLDRGSNENLTSSRARLQLS
jgi:ribosomal protein S18 acetylase RimI-like enzyme